MVYEVEWSAYFGLANAFCLLCYPLSCHALFLVCEVGPETGAGRDEEDGSREVEGLSEMLVYHATIW